MPEVNMNPYLTSYMDNIGQPAVKSPMAPAVKSPMAPAPEQPVGPNNPLNMQPDPFNKQRPGGFYVTAPEHQPKDELDKLLYDITNPTDDPKDETGLYDFGRDAPKKGFVATEKDLIKKLSTKKDAKKDIKPPNLKKFMKKPSMPNMEGLSKDELDILGRMSSVKGVDQYQGYFDFINHAVGTNYKDAKTMTWAERNAQVDKYEDRYKKDKYSKYAREMNEFKMNEQIRQFDAKLFFERGKMKNAMNLATLKSMGKGRGKILEIKQATAAANSKSVIDNLQTTLGKIADLSRKFGPVTGRITSMNKWDGEGPTLVSEMLTQIQTVGKILEGGVLRKDDWEKYLKILPTINDTPITATRKMQFMIGLLKRRTTDEINVWGATGRDVAGIKEYLGGTLKMSSETKSILNTQEYIDSANAAKIDLGAALRAKFTLDK